MNAVTGVVCCTFGVVGFSQFFLGPNAFKKLKDWSASNGNVSAPSVALQGYPAQEERMMRSIHVIAERNETSLTRKMLGLTSAALAVYLGYSYYSSNSNTKRVIDKVEDTAQETQDLVKECDDNNQKRIEELDERAEERTNELSVEIRGEQRAHFEVLSKQLNCVTQVCLQTITAIANGINGSSEDGELAQPNEQLIAYSEKAQEMSDNLFDRDTYLKAVDMHMDECRAQIVSRKNGKAKMTTRSDVDDLMITETLTAGGPDNFDKSNDNNPYVRKLSAPGMNNDKTSSNSKPKSVMDLQMVKNMKLGHLSEYYAVKYIDPVYGFARQYEMVAFGGLSLVLLGLVSRHYAAKNKNKKI